LLLVQFGQGPPPFARGVGKNRARHQGELMSSPTLVCQLSFILPTGPCAGPGGHGSSRVVQIARAACPAGVLAGAAGDLLSVAPGSAMEGSGRRDLSRAGDCVNQLSGSSGGPGGVAFSALSAHCRRVAGRNVGPAGVVGAGPGKAAGDSRLAPTMPFMSATFKTPGQARVRTRGQRCCACSRTASIEGNVCATRGSRLDGGHWPVAVFWGD
jgi:hypothetical protein